MNFLKIFFLITVMSTSSCVALNVAKNASQLSSSAIKESIIVETKDFLDPARGGGKW